MTLIKATKCSLCPRCFSDETGAEIHPEIANPVGWCICASCQEKSQAKVKAEVEQMKRKAMEDLAGRRIP